MHVRCLLWDFGEPLHSSRSALSRMDGGLLSSTTGLRASWSWATSTPMAFGGVGQAHSTQEAEILAPERTDLFEFFPFRTHSFAIPTSSAL